jgi:hypothetical protein
MFEGDVIKHRVPYSTNPKKQSAAFKLFHYRYPCEVSGIHMVSAEEYETFGYVTTGDTNIDLTLASQSRYPYLTTAQVAHMRAQFIPVKLKSYEDATKMYNLIYQHMQDWRNEVELNIMRRSAPLASLKRFDDLGRELFEFAHRYVTYNPAENSFFSAMQSIATSRGLGMRSGISRLAAAAAAAPPPEIAHTTHVEFMTRTLRERERQFRN